MTEQSNSMSSMLSEELDRERREEQDLEKVKARLHEELVNADKEMDVKREQMEIIGGLKRQIAVMHQDINIEKKIKNSLYDEIDELKNMLAKQNIKHLASAFHKFGERQRIAAKAADESGQSSTARLAEYCAKEADMEVIHYNGIARNL